MSNIKITGYNSNKTEKIWEVKFSDESEVFDYLNRLLGENPRFRMSVKKAVSKEQFPIEFRVNTEEYGMKHEFVYIIDRVD